MDVGRARAPRARHGWSSREPPAQRPLPRACRATGGARALARAIERLALLGHHRPGRRLRRRALSLTRASLPQSSGAGARRRRDRRRSRIAKPGARGQSIPRRRARGLQELETSRATPGGRRRVGPATYVVAGGTRETDGRPAALASRGLALLRSRSGLRLWSGALRRFASSGLRSGSGRLRAWGSRLRTLGTSGRRCGALGDFAFCGGLALGRYGDLGRRRLRLDLDRGRLGDELARSL